MSVNPSSCQSEVQHLCRDTLFQFVIFFFFFQLLVLVYVAATKVSLIGQRKCEPISRYETFRYARFVYFKCMFAFRNVLIHFSDQRGNGCLLFVVFWNWSFNCGTQWNYTRVEMAPKERIEKKIGTNVHKKKNCFIYTKPKTKSIKAKHCMCHWRYVIAKYIFPVAHFLRL